jgi:hypothetical protein
MWLKRLNQFRLNRVPRGRQRNHHRMDVGGPKRLCLTPLLVRWNSVLKTVALPNVVRSPLILGIYSSENVNSPYIVPLTRMLINREFMRNPIYCMFYHSSPFMLLLRANVKNNLPQKCVALTL